MTVPIIVGAVRYRRLDFFQKLIWYLMVYTLATEIWSMWYIFVYETPPGVEKNNLPIFHSYSYLEFGVIAFIFHQKLRSVPWKNVIKLISVIFYVFSIINLILWESIWVFNSNQRFLEGVLIFIILISFFIQLMRNAEDVYFERNSYFWLATGFLFYFTGTLFVFLFEKKFIDYYLASPKVDFIDYHGYIHGVLFIILNLHYTVFLWMREKK